MRKPKLVIEGVYLERLAELMVRREEARAVGDWDHVAELSAAIFYVLDNLGKDQGIAWREHREGGDHWALNNGEGKQ